jgi:hypothetical protein
MDDEIQRAFDKELQKSPRIDARGVPWRAVILMLVATLAGFLALALLSV